MPAHAYNYAGEKHGMLTAIEDVGYKGGKRQWRCLCDCGNYTVIPSARFGLTLSCGCIERSRLGARNALRLKGCRSQSPEYKSYRSMLGRCLNPDAPNYDLYGGRGITVCARWRGKSGFENFACDLGPRPVGFSLDRINNDAGYEPGNCRWATAKEQRANQRNSPELVAMRRDSLDRGRRRMWDDPELRAKLLAKRRKA